MSKRSLLLLVGCLFAAALWAEDDPFVGEWKLNPAKSRFPDEMKVASAGTNKYAFDFGAGSAETIAVDGTDQPGLAGTTLSVTVEGPSSWKVVRKKDGRMLLTAYWKLSQDGNTLKDDYTEFPPQLQHEICVQANRRQLGLCRHMGKHWRGSELGLCA